MHTRFCGGVWQKRLDATPSLCYKRADEHTRISRVTPAEIKSSKGFITMIRKIHYVWLGSPEPEAVKQNIAQWAKLNPGYEICAWHDGDIDLSDSRFGELALQHKRWGYASDIVRLKVLYEHGGFYIDCDMEPVDALAKLEPYGDKMIIGYMYDCALGTACWYAPPKHPYVADLLKRCARIKPNTWPVNNSIYTEYFINSVPRFLLNGQAWENDLCKVYPKEFFEQPAFIRRHGISVHHYCGTWKPGASFDNFSAGKRSTASHLLLWLKRKINTRRALLRNEFRPYYEAARRGESLPYPQDVYYEG